MSAKERIFFPQGVNMYVPAMGYASNLVHGQPTLFSLGTPAAVSATVISAAIDAAIVAGTKTDLTMYTMDSPYGRSLRLTPSADPGNAAAIDVFGDDYLGQPMVERFTGASGSTAILYGKKAFYRVRYVKSVTASSNAANWAIGTGFRLGLPYKSDIEWARENGVLVPLYKRSLILTQSRGAADAAAGMSKWFRPPFPGYVLTLLGTPDGGGSTNDPVVTVKLGGTAIVGLTVTVDTSDTSGLTVTDTPTTVGYNANNRFIANGLIEVVGAAAASAKGDTLALELQPTQFLGADTTDPGTTTTGDPRGTYESIAVLDGVKKIEVALIADNSVNASGNGGLHGIKHVVA